MKNFNEETITEVHHLTPRLFSFKTTRDSGFRFKNGYFTMIGLQQEDRPLVRAYSMASANHEEELEFFSIKVPDGPLTSQLQHVKPGDKLLVGKKPTGTLILDHLLPGKHLYLLSTGTGLAPFLSIIKDPEIYDQFDKVILVHGCRYVKDLAYQEMILETLPKDPYLGEAISEKLLYFPTLTREPYDNTGRITDLINTGELEAKLGLPTINTENDRFMLCGSPAMLKDTCALLEARGLREYSHEGAGHFVIERAFVER